jgi:protocatechuate 3,4-dioxygenase beta subunit
MQDKWTRPTRRGVMTMIGVTVAGATMLPQRLFAQAGNGNLIAGADVCVLVPEVTEGPYYFDPALVRHDITEGKDGLPLLVRLQIVDTACQPFEGARVDIWHCDATGIYSGYANQTAGVNTVGETFLRGTQFTGADGVAEFATIYPGWYPGRTTHIHFKAFLDEVNVLTGQIFFDEALNDAVYASVPAYARTATRTTLNANDGIAQQAGPASIATVDQNGAAYVAALIVGVDPNAISTNGGGPGGAGGFMGPPPR